MRRRCGASEGSLLSTSLAEWHAQLAEKRACLVVGALVPWRPAHDKRAPVEAQAAGAQVQVAQAVAQGPAIARLSLCNIGIRRIGKIPPD